MSETDPNKNLEIGLEPSPEEYVAQLVAVFREVKRVLRQDGVCFIDLGDSYAGSWGARGRSADTNAPRSDLESKYGTDAPARNGVPEQGIKPKDLIGIPWMVAFALRADGWWLRSALPWIKRSCMPESTTDRPTSAVEYVFLLTKQARYFWDAEAVKRKGVIPAGTRAAKGSEERAKHANGRPPEYATYNGTRNFRNSDLFFDTLAEPLGLILDETGDPLALDVNPEPFHDAHFATYPPKLIAPLIKAGTSERGCCPHCGSPWERVVDRQRTRDGKPLEGSFDTGDGYKIGASGVGHWRDVSHTTTIGWRQTCSCVEFRCQSCATVLDTDNAKETVASTIQPVRDMRRGVSSVSPRWEVLQQDVLRRASEETDADSMRAVQKAIPAQKPERQVLQQVLFNEMDSEESLDGQRLVGDIQRIQADSTPGAPECEPLWLRDGTSARNGEDVRPTTDGGRGRSPQERGSFGQSDCQFGVDGQAPTRQFQTASLSCDVPSLPEGISSSRPCPNCGSGMERTTPAPAPCVVLDCFFGAGTTGLVADRLGRNCIGVELNEAYSQMTKRRIEDDAGMFANII